MLVKSLPGSPGSAIWTTMISVNTLLSCSAPMTTLIFHAEHSLETGWPSVSSMDYVKPRDVPPTTLSLLQFATFARVLQIPIFQACCQMLVGDCNFSCGSQWGNLDLQYNDNKYSSNYTLHSAVLLIALRLCWLSAWNNKARECLQGSTTSYFNNHNSSLYYFFFFIFQRKPLKNAPGFDHIL